LQREQISTALASLANYTLYGALSRCAELGFSAIGFLAMAGARHSIGDLPGFGFDELKRTEREELRQATQPFRRVSLHAAFQDAPHVTYNRHIMETSKQLVKTPMEAAANLGADAVAIHVNSRPYFDAANYWNPLVAVLREQGDYGMLLCVRVGVETGYPRDLQSFLRIILEADHPMVGATLDVGHVAFSVERELWGTDACVRQHNQYIHDLCVPLGNKLFHMHIHDVRKEDWRDHRAVGTGIIDWPALFACLKAVNYKDCWNWSWRIPIVRKPSSGAKHTWKRCYEQSLTQTEL
jgi:sugar phosphate isomerase/epimerase